MRQIQLSIPADKRIVAVSGGRNFLDEGLVWHVLDQLPIGLLLEGGARTKDLTGVDWYANRWSKLRGVNCLIVWPKPHIVPWPGAGPVRNKEMGDIRPDYWVLFPGGPGTDSARRVAIAGKIPRIEVTQTGSISHPDPEIKIPL